MNEELTRLADAVRVSANEFRKAVAAGIRIDASIDEMSQMGRSDRLPVLVVLTYLPI